MVMKSNPKTTATSGTSAKSSARSNRLTDGDRNPSTGTSPETAMLKTETVYGVNVE